MMRDIAVYARNPVTGLRGVRRFQNLDEAQGYVRELLGPRPEVGGRYARSADGATYVSVHGVKLSRLFPEAD